MKDPIEIMNDMDITIKHFINKYPRESFYLKRLRAQLLQLMIHGASNEPDNYDLPCTVDYSADDNVLSFGDYSHLGKKKED